jgi:hypothetical protein
MAEVVDARELNVRPYRRGLALFILIYLVLCIEGFPV